jgi:pimeloyl-ACP methyl ester carboxylesterase
MPIVTTQGIPTHYEVTGSGPALLMFSPGGFNGVAANWSKQGIYRRLNLVEHLSSAYTCIMFDRRESGASGGRLERVTWRSYVDQALALLDHLDVAEAHAMGGCVGCSSAAALAIAAPERVTSLVLYSPAGGARYRMSQHARFIAHLAFVAENGLGAVVALARETEAIFNTDPRVGPWGSVLRADPDFSAAFVTQDPDRYAVMVTGMMRGLFDRDTVPGVEPEDLLGLNHRALVVPGDDASHAPSAARFFQECLSNVQYWDMPVPEQTEATAPPRILEFLLGG